MLYRLKGVKLIYNMILLLILYVQISSRAFILESHAWVLLPTLFYVYIVVSHTIGARLALGGFLISTTSILYNYFFAEAGRPYLSEKWQFIVNFAIPISFYLIVNFYREKIEQRKVIETRKYQKRDTISKMIITLAHELNNPLTISKLSLEKIKTNPSEVYINRCEEGLERITNISNLINHIHDIEEIDYGPNSKMYDLFREIKLANEDQ